MQRALTMPPHGNTKYPWALWEDGEVHKVTKGRGFDCDPRTFQAMLRNRAVAKKRTVETRLVGKKKSTVAFQFKAGT